MDAISAKIKLSEGTATARLFIKTGSGWTWSDSGIPVTIESSGYATLTISLPEAATAAGVDLSVIKTIGIKVEDIGNSGGTAKLLLQEIVLAAAPAE
ncbi:hypothetical protein D3C73_1328880 [compost metagenome]